MKTRSKLIKTAILGLLILFLSNANLQAQCTQLVWSDEFNGTAVDGTKWQSITGNGCPSLCGFGNAEAQRYDPNRATIVKDGTNSYLNIEARYEPSSAYPDNPYSAAKLTTEGKFSIKYGRIEARMKLPSGQGAWPAFWMLPNTANWPTTGEIDIMETKHRNPKVTQGTIHYNSGGHQYSTADYTSTVDLSSDFHIYAVEWAADSIKWYVDGKLFYTATPKTTVGGSWPFNSDNFYIILNLAVGSVNTPYTSVNGVGVAPVPGDYPVKMQVDYVRVYSGTNTYSIAGDATANANQSGKVYSITSIPNATYSWTVPAGATITAGQGTNSITVKWGTTGGNVGLTTTTTGCSSGTVTNSYVLPVSITPSIVGTDMLENYDGTRLITKGVSTGTYTADVANPGSNTVNTSAKAAKYVRNSAELYDVLFFNTGTNIKDAGQFKDGTFKIQVDMYTTAPVGTVVTLNFENNPAAQAGNYPTGRNSVYLATTTKQNQWETLTFTYSSSPDLNTSNVTVNQIVFLFNSGTYTNHTYYIDNIRIGKTKVDMYTNGAVYEDYQSIHAISLNSAVGTYTPNVANPSITAGNSSSTVAKYVRNSGQQYDNISFATSITNADEFKSGTKRFALDLYTTAPVGTVITLQFESSALSTSSNYPTGRHSAYQAVVEKTNSWQTIVFNYTGTPDAGTTNAQVNRFVFLFNPGTYTADTYYVDNLRSLNVLAGTGSTNIAKGKAATASSSETSSLMPNNVTDSDNIATRWASGFGNASEWIYVDLGSNYSINKINLVWEAAYATNYQVQVSTDLNWTNKTIQTITGSDGGLDTISLTATGRYVRILGTQKALTQYGYSLFTIEVYGTASTAKMATSAKNINTDIAVYPNPADNFIKITTPSNQLESYVKIFDLTGKSVLEKTLDAQNTESVVNIASLPAGLYVLNIISGETTYSRKLIKK